MPNLLNYIPCVYFSASANGLIVDVNQTLCDYLNYTADELTGRKLETIFTLSTRIFQQTHLYPLLQISGHAEEIYITLRRKDGTDAPVLINASRKEKEGEMQFFFAGVGLNKRKKFEDEIIAAKKTAEKALAENSALKAAREQLQNHAEELDRQFTLINHQNQELKQFNHLSTHTLQEPLRKVLFYLSQVLDSNDGAKIVSGAQKIKKAADDMAAKLKGLQQLVWLTSEELLCEPVNLHEVIETVQEKLALENPALSIQLKMEEIPVIEANLEQMQMLMQEILSNAIRFRKEGNVVTIKIFASTIMLNNFRQLSGKYKYTEFEKLVIEDSGIGFDDKYQDQAFQLFRKLNAASGIGVGLSLCKKIVENHHGSISLESQEGLGCKVVLLLPLQQKKQLVSSDTTPISPQ